MYRATVLHVAREGWPFILLAAALALFCGVYVSVWLSIPFALLTLYAIAFFHEPERELPRSPLAIAAPLDGRILHRRESFDPYLERDAIKISVEVNPLGAYCIRAAVEGKVLELIPGRRLPRGITASWIQTDDRDDVVVVITRGSLFGARPCVCNFGDRVGQGRRCGFRRLARHLDVYLPPNSRVEVKNGQYVRAGQDVLAYLVHKEPVSP